MKNHIHYYVNTEDGKLVNVSKPVYEQALQYLENDTDFFYNEEKSVITTLRPEKGSLASRSKIRATFTTQCGIAEYCDSNESVSIVVEKANMEDGKDE